jgi:hypothetical protein
VNIDNVSAHGVNATRSDCTGNAGREEPRVRMPRKNRRNLLSTDAQASSKINERPAISEHGGVIAVLEVDMHRRINACFG